MKRRMFRKGYESRKRWSDNANAAKARKRLSSTPPDHEPRMIRWNRFELTVTDRLTGERGTFELRSVRDAARRLAILTRFYE